MLPPSSPGSAGRLPGDDCGQDWIRDRDVEAAPAQDILQLAARAWDAQLRHLLQDSVFYAGRLARAGLRASLPRLGDLPRLPFTNKEDLRAAIEADPPFGTNVSVPLTRVKRVYQTSGTTGVPSVIALSDADAETWTAIGTRTYFATGIHEHHAVLTTFGAGPFVAGHTGFVLGRIGTRTVPVGPGNTERVLFALRSGLADTFLCTPSFAQYVANRLGEDPQGARGLALGHVVTGGEPGGGIPAVRGHIEDALGVKVTEVMGLGDVSPSLFGECPLQKGMHFCGAGYVWPELVDPDSREPMTIEAGAVGELVYTSLRREAMPVLRFLGGDVVRVEGVGCGCGRTGFRMRCLGRRDDMFIVRGVNVHPSAILGVVGDFRPQVTGRARVVRKSRDVRVEPPVPVEVEVAPGGAADPALAARIEAAIRSRLTFRSRVELVQEVDFGESGYKTRLTVRR